MTSPVSEARPTAGIFRDTWGDTRYNYDVDQVTNDYPVKVMVGSVAHRIFNTLWPIVTTRLFSMDPGEAEMCGIYSTGDRKLDAYHLNAPVRCSVSIVDMIRIHDEGGPAAFRFENTDHRKEVFDLLKRHLDNWESVLRVRQVPTCPKDDLMRMSVFAGSLIDAINAQALQDDVRSFRKVIAKSEKEFREYQRLIAFERPDASSSTYDPTAHLDPEMTSFASSTKDHFAEATIKGIDPLDEETFERWRTEPVKDKGLFDAIQSLLDKQ